MITHLIIKNFLVIAMDFLNFFSINNYTRIKQLIVAGLGRFMAT